MKKAYIFVFGGSGTLLLSAFLFVLMPRLQVSEVERLGVSSQRPYTELEQAGRKVYIEYGCLTCHSQQVRDPAAGADAQFGWGPPSKPSDYIYDRPHLLGTSRTGPDLSNIGVRQPSADWHHLHLYDPRLLVDWSLMPAHPFLYQTVTGTSAPSPDAVALPGGEAWLVPTPEAKALVAYLLALRRDGAPQPAPQTTPQPLGEQP